MLFGYNSSGLPQYQKLVFSNQIFRTKNPEEMEKVPTVTGPSTAFH